MTKLNAAGSVLLYSTFLGGSGADAARGLALDSAANAHVTGSTASPDFPTTPGAFDQTWNGINDAFATKLNSSGSALLYSTFLGGTLDDDGFGIAVAVGDVFLHGVTTSPDYPTTPGAFDTTFNGSRDYFVTRLDLAAACPDDDGDDDGLTDERELMFLTLVSDADSDDDGVPDGNEDSDDDGEDDEDEDDDEDECPNDSDDDGEDDEDEDD